MLFRLFWLYKNSNDQRMRLKNKFHLKVSVTTAVKFLTMKENDFRMLHSNPKREDFTVLIIPLDVDFRNVLHFNPSILVIGSDWFL